jgi:predicted transcriptional regulator
MLPMQRTAQPSLNEKTLDMRKVVASRLGTKGLTRIDWKIITRLVTFLHYNARMKRTLIATRCNLSYDNCIRYLNWLEMMELIEKQIDVDGYQTIVLSQRGHSLYKRQLNWD